MIINALISSIVEVCVTQPIDVIKIHKQASIPIKYNWQTLYRGFIPRALGNIPSRSIFLFSQDYLKQYFNSNKFSPLLVPIGSGFGQTLIDTPVEVLKMNQIVKTSNYLYKGFIPHLGRNILFLVPVYNLRQFGDNTIQTALYGSLGGIIGAYISHPLDTIKTHMQVNKDYKNLTIKEYFRGCHLRASMSMINMGISLFVFEYMNKFSNIRI